MDIQIAAALAGPFLKLGLNYVIPRIPNRFKPLIAPIVSILGWAIASYVIDLPIQETFTNALLTAGGAVMTHETMKDTVGGGK